MSKKFENKKLNKEDHANVDREAGVARGAAEGVAGLAALGLIIKTVPWKKVAGGIVKVGTKFLRL